VTYVPEWRNGGTKREGELVEGCRERGFEKGQKTEVSAKRDVVKRRVRRLATGKLMEAGRY
jgi:hypothetical protein